MTITQSHVRNKDMCLLSTALYFLSNTTDTKHLLQLELGCHSLCFFLESVRVKTMDNFGNVKGLNSIKLGKRHSQTCSSQNWITKNRYFNLFFFCWYRYFNQGNHCVHLRKLSPPLCSSLSNTLLYPGNNSTVIEQDRLIIATSIISRHGSTVIIRSQYPFI